jgi:triacylglycerol lipase
MRRVRIGFTIALVVASSSLAAGALAAQALAAAPLATRTPTVLQRDPVLLVHGFNGSGASWHVLRQQLRDGGYPDRAVEAISYDSTASNVTVADEIRSAVDALLARNDARTVDIIGHSMGTIAARYYVEHLDGSGNVDAFVSLAGVNRGTIWAVGCAVLVSCREMLPGSSLIDGFAPDVTGDLPTRFGAWWSPCDPAIVPHTNAELPGADNTETDCIGHSELKTDPRVLDEVLDFIARRHTVIA